MSRTGDNAEGQDSGELKRVLTRMPRLDGAVVHASIGGDVRFPEIEPGTWREVARAERGADERNGYDLSFIELVRRRGGEIDPHAADG